MKLTETKLRQIIRSVIKEETEYQKFFKKELEKTGKSIPQMSDEEKKAFFNKIDKAWKGKGESVDELTKAQEKLPPALKKAIQKKEKKESVNEGIWPKSKLPDRFEFILSDELKKNFKGIFYVVGYDLYYNDIGIYSSTLKKVMTINPDKDSVNSIIKSLKSKLKESVNEAKRSFKFKHGIKHLQQKLNKGYSIEGGDEDPQTYYVVDKNRKTVGTFHYDGNTVTLLDIPKGIFRFRERILHVNEAKVIVYNEKTGERYEVLSGKAKGDLLIAMKALQSSAPSHMKYSIKESVNEAKFKKGDKVIVDNPWGTKPVKGVIDFTLKTPKGDVYVLKNGNGVWDEKYIKLAESVNEAKFDASAYKPAPEWKKKMQQRSEFGNLLSPNDVKFLVNSQTKTFTKGNNLIVTDGNRWMVFNTSSPVSKVKRLGNAPQSIKDLHSNS